MEEDYSFDAALCFHTSPALSGWRGFACHNHSILICNANISANL